MGFQNRRVKTLHGLPEICVPSSDWIGLSVEHHCIVSNIVIVDTLWTPGQACSHKRAQGDMCPSLKKKSKLFK